MQMIEQSYEIVYPSCEQHELWHDMLCRVEDAGRTCYQSANKDDPGKFVGGLVRSGHHSVLEHASISVRFVTDRGVTHELVRHRIGVAFSQESTRYCSYGKDHIRFIRPVWCSEDLLGEWRYDNRLILNSSGKEAYGPEFGLVTACLDAEAAYRSLLQQKWTPQQARAVLPNALKTEIVMTANLREWMHVFNLRCSKSAHPQIRELLAPLREELRLRLPEVFSTTTE